MSRGYSIRRHCVCLWCLVNMLLMGICRGYAQSDMAAIDTLHGVAVYDLRTQYRTYQVDLYRQADTLCLQWSLTREGETHCGRYLMSLQSLQHATELCYVAPQHGQTVVTPPHQLFACISADALMQLRTLRRCRYNNTQLTVLDADDTMIHVKDFDEGYEMWIRNDLTLPLIVRMLHNPVEIDWQIELKR